VRTPRHTAVLLRALAGLAGLCLAGACASAPRPAPVDPGAVDRHVAGPIALRYRDTGGRGPALVLVHGNFDALETWARVVPRLADHFRVITLDLPGFGASDNPFGAWDYGTLALGVALVMDDARVERAALVGNSLGGGVAAAFAARFPDRVVGLGLVDANLLPALMTTPTPEAQARVGDLFRAANALAAKPSDPTAAAALREATRAALQVALPTPGAIDDALVERYARGFEGARFEAVKRVNAATLRSLEELAADLERALRDRDVPMVIVWGLADPLLPIENADLIKARFPKARLVLLDGTGHGPQLERPVELADALVTTFGPSPTSKDTYVAASGDDPARHLGPLNRLPFIERVVREALVAQGDAQRGQLPWLALNQLATGDVAAALVTADRLASPALGLPAGDVALADLVRGAAHEVAGDRTAAAASYLAALRAMRPEDHAYALARAAQLPLDDAQAEVVDALLGAPLGEAEPTALLIARIDRLLARERWSDALALLDRYRIEVPLADGIALRRALAERGAGRDPMGRPGGLASASALEGHRLMTARERPTLVRLDRCRRSVQQEREALDDLGLPPLQTCAPLAIDRLAFLLGPPPVIVSAEAPGTALGAIARARAALAGARDADALAELEAVPAERASQTPELHRLRLSLRAARGRRDAVVEARAHAAAHADDLAWQRALATTLAAAGKLREARTLLVSLAVARPAASLREELAYVEAALGHDREARVILDALRRRQPLWRGSPTRHLPHLAAHAERLWRAP